jgi:TP53 regulating kinase-like protein
MKPKLIAQGAEAKIYLTSEASKITKERTKKSYRHPALDKKIRKQRTNREARILKKAHELKINVPKITHIDNREEEMKLYLEFLEGDRLSQTLNSYKKESQLETMKLLGKEVAKLHKNNIIHADLTTSNTILKNSKVYLIDFGLSYISSKIEDKAVDLHLIKQALEAKHFQNHEDLFKAFCKGYIWKDSKKILERLNIVEKRGRYKH